ncbi:MAG: hypothetical protein ACP5H2_11440 [Solirubrobacteraceae bacterium]
MSGSASDMSLASIGAQVGYPDLNVASIPQAVRDGGTHARQAYAEGLAFESVLVNELSQQLAATMFEGNGVDGDKQAGGGGSLGGTDSAGASFTAGTLSGASAYASLIPQALTTSIMDGGGLGMAAQFAQQLDPSLDGASAGAGTGSGQVAS